MSSAADLFLSALGSKLIPILGQDARAHDVIESSIKIRNCISAVEDGELLGILAIQTKNKSFIDPSFEDMVSVYGLISGIARTAKLSLLTHVPKNDEIHVEGIAVMESARGKGIGTRLLNELFSFASEMDKKRITLEVINTNPKAKDLYEQLGFNVEKRENVWPFNKIIGWSFNEVIKMSKNVA